MFLLLNLLTNSIFIAEPPKTASPPVSLSFDSPTQVPTESWSEWFDKIIPGFKKHEAQGTVANFAISELPLDEFTAIWDATQARWKMPSYPDWTDMMSRLKSEGVSSKVKRREFTKLQSGNPNCN